MFIFLYTKKSLETSKGINEFIINHGTPEMIQADNGLEFKGEFDKLLNSKFIKHVKGRPYHPESQGSVESFNKFIKEKLRELLSKSQEKKPSLQEAVDSFLKEYNNERMHSATGEIPSNLFNCKNNTVLERVQKRLESLRKYQKSKIQAIKGAVIGITNHCKIYQTTINYFPEKGPRNFIAIGELQTDFVNEYAEIKILKSSINLNLCSGEYLVDPKACIVISQNDLELFLEIFK